ncbi:MAG TPA: glycosyltransferase [Solirubrobacterales bacterium]|nr:glycosyltransferase [Solirubrobacterales bacterium]
MAATSPLISVVIPTRDRPEALARCLERLRDEPGVEVIVVDDGSSAPALKRVEELLGGASARLLRPGRGGPAAARNAGAEAAGGEWVCFVDDDCAPEPGWPQRLAAAAERSLGVAAGRTLPPPDAGPAALASQTIIDHLQLDGAGPDGLAFAPSCNLCLGRDVAAEHRFDESFLLAGGEDRELCDRLAADGRAPAYAPDAVVVHHQREGLRAMLARQYRYGRGGSRYRRGGGARPPGRFYAGLLARARRRGAATVLCVGLAQLATVAGALRERLGRR